MSSAFDDLLGLGGGDGSSQPVDLLAPSSAPTGGSTGGGDLLDLGFDAPVSTQNGSGKLKFEANTNPLYELSNSTGSMEGEANNPLFDLGVETTQKDTTKADTSSGNPLYDYFQNDVNTNGHGEDVLINGNGNTEDVDLLGISSEPTKAAATSDDSGVTVDDSSNLNESNTDENLIDTSNDLKDLEQEPEPEPVQEVQDKLVPELEQEPVIVEQEQVVVEQEPIVEVDTKVEEEPVVEVEQVVEEVHQEQQEPEAEQEPEVVEEQEEEEQQNKAADLQEGSVKITDQSEGPEETAITEREQEPVADVPDAPMEDAQNTEQAQTVANEPEMVNGVEDNDKVDGVDPVEAEIPATDNIQPTDEVQSTDEAQPVAEAAPEDVKAPEPEVVDSDLPAEPKQVQTVIAEPEQGVAEQSEEPTQAQEAEEEPKPAEMVSTEPVEIVPNQQDEVDQAIKEPSPVVEAPAEPAESVPVESAPEPLEQEATIVKEDIPPVEAPAESEKEQEPVAEMKEDVPQDIPMDEPVEQEETLVETPAEPEPVVEIKEEAPQEVPLDEPAVQEDTPPVEAPAEPEQVPEPVVETKTEAPQEVPEPAVQEDTPPVEAPAETEQVPAEPELVPEPVVETKTEVPQENPANTKDEPAVSNEEPKPKPPVQSPVAETPAETATTEATENGVAKVNGTSEVKENGMSEEETVRDPDIFRETREKEEIHFAEMNNFRQKFESGKIDDKEPELKKKSVKEEYDAGGEFENEPVKNPDVISEADRASEDLPEVGTAKNLVDKFKTISEEKAQPVRSQKRESPARQEKVEYESTPTERLVIEEGKSETGEFESTPATREDVVRSGDRLEDAQPEKGYAKNIMNKFKDIQTNTGTSSPREKREITPDKSGKVEYTSEPRGQKIEYEENKADTGVYENQPKGDDEDVVRSGDKTEEALPESGLAKNLLSKFKQMESEVGNRPPPSPKREVRAITPDKSGKTEYVSEPRGDKIEYEAQKEDQGVFESKPVVPVEVVRSEDAIEDYKPEPGMAKKTLERYKEMQNQSSSPSSAGHKEFTPPRETSPGKTVSGVVENTPAAARDDVVRCGERREEELPEQGSAKNIVNKFKEIQSSAGSSPIMSPNKKPKEITPPPESGVYENTPDEHLVIEPQKAFEGVLESTPSKSQADVARDYVHSPEREIPESGMAKNLVSKFRQLESTSAKTSSSTSPRFKEFTPPRDRGPLSPKSPIGHPTDGVDLKDLPGQYQQQGEKPGVFENEPEVKADVYREADTDWTEGMPAPNTTMSMLQKFKSIQQQAKDNEKTPAPVSRKVTECFIPLPHSHLF